MRDNGYHSAPGLAALALALGTPVAAQPAQDSPPPVAEIMPAGPTANGKDIVLPIGMRIALVTDAEISSKRARKGDLVTLRAKDDLVHAGKVFVAAGTSAVGEITEVQQKGMMGQGGRLSLRMLYLEMGDGRTVRVSGQIASIGDDQTALASAATTATMGFVFFVTGKSATIPEGTELQVTLDREVRFRGAAQ